VTSDPALVRLAFAFTDIEGSTRLLERLGAAYAAVLGDHAAVIRAAIGAHGGREVDTQGDAFFAVFPDAAGALRFSVDVQRGLAAHPWPDGVTVRVRIGLHAGEAIPTRTGFVGMDVHHGARVAAAAHGGQVLCSGALAVEIADTRAAMGDEGEETPDLVPLGAFGLKDIREPVELLQWRPPALDADFRHRVPRRARRATCPRRAALSGSRALRRGGRGRFFGRDAGRRPRGAPG
jgi:class 3 adenylate cyclase